MKEGDVIFESEVFSHVINPDIASQVCDYCLYSLDTTNITRHNKSLNRCSKCQVVYYCDKRCQAGGWRAHKVECNFISSVKPNVPPPTGRHVIRTLIKLKQGGDKEYEVLPDGSHRMFDTLMTHEEDIKKDSVRVEAFAYYLKMVYMCFGESAFTADFVFKVFCRLMINSVEINDHLFRSIGTGLYINLSAIDHDCRPNANVIFIGRKARIFALEAVPEPIMKNLRISYNSDDLITSKERRAMLRKQFYFTCTCTLCTSKEEENLTSLPCSKCKIEVNVNVDLNSSDPCNKCGQPIETVRLNRLSKWHLKVDNMKEKIDKGQVMYIDILQDAFDIYREGMAMEVKNDLYLYLSANFVFRSLLACEEPPQDLITIKIVEAEDICNKLLEQHKKLYHDNSLQIGMLYMEIATVIRMFKSASSVINVKKLIQESLRIHELFYTRDSDIYKRLVADILIISRGGERVLDLDLD